MKSTKAKIIIIVSLIVAVVLTAALLTLGFTVWRPKSAEEWLNDFSGSMTVHQGQDNQKLEKTIIIEEEGSKISSFLQTVEIYNQGGRPVGHIVMEELYFNLDTTEFDTYDEYLFYDGVMHMSRKNDDEITYTEFSSTWEIFWEVFNENWGNNKYSLDKALLEEFKINHSENTHTLTALVADNNRRAFFNDSEDFKDISKVGLEMSIDNNLKLIDFKLQYKYKEKQDVTIQIVSKESTYIEIEDLQS